MPDESGEEIRPSGFGHSFVIRHSSFVICLLCLTLSASAAEPFEIKDGDRVLLLGDALPEHLLERLGLGYDAVSAVNPGLVFCGTYGYGRKGPYAERGAYDDSIQAISGVAGLPARTGGEPQYAATILGDQNLSQLALSLGETTFNDNCAACHGGGGRGAKGYPRLADDIWLWGGSLEQIHHTISVGIRSGAADRVSQMPAFGRDQMLKPEQVSALLWTIVSSNVATVVGFRAEALGRPPREDELEPVTRAMLAKAEAMKPQNSSLVIVQARASVGPTGK